MKETEIYALALKTWGKEPQMLQVIEEMSELTKEILKNINRNRNNIPELIEETADVEIMLAQLKQCYGIENEVTAYKSQKLEKIRLRLDEFNKKAI
ncbi:MAG: hypothetical protein ACI4OW_01875 [Alphaproteobacteria bacterium]